MTAAGLAEGADAVRERLAHVRAQIDAASARAERSAESVDVVAVTKGFPPATVADAVEGGVRSVGENRAQELLAKDQALREQGGPLPSEWHFVGRIQRNKIAKLAGLVEVWHSVDRAEVGEAIARRAPGARVYAQVDLGDEPQKGGCTPGEAPALVDELRRLGLEVEGLMTVPPAADDDPRPHFARLRQLAAAVGVSGLSMGMSGDYEVAVEEGATVVRLGSTVFGPRPS